MKFAKSILAFIIMGTFATGVIAGNEVKITDVSKAAKVVKLKVGGLRTLDKYKLTSLPEELKGMQCVSVKRGDHKKNGKEYSFTVDVPVTVYLLIDKRNSKFKVDGWKKTKLIAKWKAAKTIFIDAIFKKDFPAGMITIPVNPKNSLPNVAIVKAK